MSIDNQKLILTPNGYKAGKNYSIKPTDGSGDFTMSRGTSKTRVNKDKVIESVGNDVLPADYTNADCPVLALEPQRTNLVHNSLSPAEQLVVLNNETLHTVSMRGSGSVDVFDIDFQKSGDVGNAPRPVAVDSQDNVYVTCLNSDDVYVFNGTSWSKSGDVGDVPRGVAVDSQDNVYVVCDGSDDVYVYNGTSWSKSGDVGTRPFGVAVDSQDNVYVSCRDTNDVFVFDGTSWSKSGDVGSEPYGLAIDSQDNVYVACDGSDDVYVYDGTSWSKSGDVGNRPIGVAIDSQDNVYVACFNSNDVYVYNGNSWSKSGDVGSEPVGVAVDSQDNVYVSCLGSDDVYVYNGSSWSKSGDVGNGPRGVAVDSQDNVYVACLGSDDVYVFNDLTNFGTATQSNPLTFSANDLTIKLVPNNADAMQCEEGNNATSVIATGDVFVTRNQDILTNGLTSTIDASYSALIKVEADNSRLKIEDTDTGFDLPLNGTGNIAMVVDSSNITFHFPDTGQANTTVNYEKPADLRNWEILSKLGRTGLAILSIENGIISQSKIDDWVSGTISSDWLQDYSTQTDFDSVFRTQDWDYFPAIDLSSGTDFNDAWRDNNLTSFPAIDLSSGTKFGSAWFGNNLTSFPAIDLSSGTSFYRAWLGNALTTFPANMFDNNNTGTYTNAFSNNALDQQSVDDILVSIEISAQANNITNGELDINGGTNATPSATGQAAADSLRNTFGWTVTLNGY